MRAAGVRLRGLLPRLAIAALVLVAPAAARAQYADTTLFSANSLTGIYTVNRLTGAATSIGTLSFNTSALARSPLTGNLYYTSHSGTLGRVAYFNPTTGTNTIINNTGNGDDIVRLTFNSAGELYGIGDTPSRLYRINPTTGAYTSLGNVKIGSSSGADLGGSGDLAFDYDGTLYATANDGTGASLYRLSLTPSGGVYVATFIRKYATITQASLAFVADGRLYSAGMNNAIYVLSKTGGAATTLVTGGPIDYADFATSPRFADLNVTGSTTGLPRGDTAVYAMNVTNGGPQSANGQITVIDSLPAGLTYAGVTGTGWSCSVVGQAVTCVTAGPLAVGATTSFSLSATVAAGAAGVTLTNIARVTGSTIDHDQSDNRTTINGVTTAVVSLSLTKRHVGNFTVGVNGDYTVVASNTGTVPTVGTLTFTDTLPTGMSIVTGVGTGMTCGVTGTPQVISCTLPTVIAVGDSVVATFTVSVAAAAAPGVTNRVWASGGGLPAPVMDADPTVVNTAGVTLTPDGGLVSQLPSNGTSYTGTFTITNTGSASGTFTLAATKAPGTSLAITSVKGTAGTTSSITLAAGASAAVPVVYTVVNAAVQGAVDTLRLLATSTTNGAINDPGSIIVTVVRAGLTMTKVLYRANGTTLVGAGQVSPGEIVQFLVTVTATGTVASTAVKVTDPIPAGVTFLSATGDLAGWTITQAAGLVTADLAGTLAIGASRFFWIRVTVQ